MSGISTHHAPRTTQHSILMRRACFLSIDGGDGVGKSTQIELLVEWLRQAGLEVVTCRDPGTHDPKARVGRQKFLRLFDQIGFHQHPGKIRGETDFRHLAKLNIFVFNFGLAGFQPIGGFK